MASLREWVNRLVAWVRPVRSDADLEEEVRAHIDLALEDVQRRTDGPPGDARRTALVRLGGAARAVDALRDQRGLPWLDDLAHDLRYAMRGARRSTVLSAVIVLSLALGIGANTALFSLIDAAFLRELPVESPGDLVYLQWRSREWRPELDRFAGSSSLRFDGTRSPTLSNAAFDALRAQTGTLTDLFAFRSPIGMNARIDRQADAATVQPVSGNYFAGLGVTPILGRVLAPEDDALSSPPALVISARIWERRFARSAAAVGASVSLDGQAFTIVGVTPDAFRGAASGADRRPDFWIPLAFVSWFDPMHAEPGFWGLTVMGRRAPGATLEQVRAALEGPFRAVVRAVDAAPSSDLPELHVLPARRGASDEGPRREQDSAVILGVIFSVLLLIVCLNVGNLLLSRAAARRAEIDVRLALGATRGRLVRQLLAESVGLAVAGGTLGLALASWGKGIFAASALVPPEIDLRLNGGVFAATLGLSALCGLLFGLVPAFRTTRVLRGRVPGSVGIRCSTPSRLTRLLLVTQVATSVVLLVGAGLFVRTLGRWNSMDAGFDVDRLLVFSVNPERPGDDPARATALLERLVARIRTIPGVRGVATSGPFWEDQGFGSREIRIDGESPAVPFDPFTMSSAERRGLRWLSVSHDFFDTLGLPILAGRGFRPEEDKSQPSVVVIDETLARRLFGDRSPLGRQLTLADAAPMTIVGVAGAMWMPSTRPDDIRPTLYVPASAGPSHFRPDLDSRRAAYRVTSSISVEIRTVAEPPVLLPAIRTAVSEIEPGLPIVDPKTVVQGMRERLQPTRIVSVIWLSFGAVTLALTAVGLYGLLAGGVAQRRQEIGIRTALGARRPAIVSLVAGQALRLVLLGLGIGLAASMAVHQLVRAYLFGVTVYDPLTLLAVAVLLLAVAGVAAYLPTRTALSLDVAAAVRQE